MSTALVVVFAIGALAPLVAVRLRLPGALLEIVAGIVLGPFAWRLQKPGVEHVDDRGEDLVVVVFVGTGMKQVGQWSFDRVVANDTERGNGCAADVVEGAYVVCGGRQVGSQLVAHGCLGQTGNPPHLLRREWTGR